MYEQYETVLVEVKEQYAIVSLNRPNAMNALNLRLIADLGDVFARLAQDDSVLGVILTGQGRAFCAGGDVLAARDIKGNLNIYNRDYARHAQSLMMQIYEFPKPVIAAVNGYAFGGGFEMALSCDFIYAAEGALFGLTEARLGMMPGYGGTQRLQRLVGLARTKELIYAARRISAEEALDYGIALACVAGEDLIGAVESKMREILKNAPLSIRFAKAILNQGTDMPVACGLELEASFLALLKSTDDAKEGVRAFSEKRAPDFKNM